LNRAMDGLGVCALHVHRKNRSTVFPANRCQFLPSLCRKVRACSGAGANLHGICGGPGYILAGRVVACV
jgi:hypothetical protein